MEYRHMGIYTFIVNSSAGRSKFGVIIRGVNSAKNMDNDEGRFFYNTGIPRPDVGFFDSGYWNIEIVEMETKRLEAILDKVYNYIHKKV